MRLTWTAIVFANLVWGLAPILAKTGLQGVDEVHFLLVRFALSSLILAPWMWPAMKKMRRCFAKGADGLGWIQLAVGACTVAIHYYLQVFALKQAPVTWYVFFYSLCPILSLFIVRGPVSRRLILTGLTALVGCSIFADMQGGIGALTLTALIASVFTWVLFTWSVQSWQSLLTDAEISATVSGLSFVVFLAIAVVRGSPAASSWNGQAFFATLTLAILLPLAFFAYSFALRRHAGLAVIGQYAEPLFGTAGAVVLLHEALSLRQTAGLIIVACALIGARKA
jgi:drug/metabolite transporter (DMT)-like permease